MEPKDTERLNPTKHNLYTLSRIGPRAGDRSKWSHGVILLSFFLLFAANATWLYFLMLLGSAVPLLIVFLKSVRLPNYFSRFELGNRFTPEVPTRPDEFFVDVSIYVDGKYIGTDRGVIGIEDDLLFFAGSASSFALGRQDIDRNKSFGKSWRTDLSVSMSDAVLHVIHPRVNLDIGVKPVKTLGENNRFPSSLEPLRLFVVQGKDTKRPRSFPPTFAPVVSKKRHLPLV